eukprot:TRINITY_DN799_c0_g1_i1.p1 TRINITY_DN799_c0_g1~~TRINITY_DN799_c0_g1_i1.p1  ORF type:complete len:55 (+),score=5.25 TRINITY_DN799_c0_g1_i1:197-361(+)
MHLCQCRKIPFILANFCMFVLGMQTFHAPMNWYLPSSNFMYPFPCDVINFYIFV